MTTLLQFITEIVAVIVVIKLIGRSVSVQVQPRLGERPAGAVAVFVFAFVPVGIRRVAADLKWLGEEHWIGLSGHEIKPKVYFAAGVSGQIQHVAGIRGSKLIVAINTNKDAPIFQISDYGIVGDLYKVLPELTKKLKA